MRPSIFCFLVKCLEGAPAVIYQKPAAPRMVELDKGGLPVPALQSLEPPVTSVSPPGKDFTPSSFGLKSEREIIRTSLFEGKTRLPITPDTSLERNHRV